MADENIVNASNMNTFRQLLAALNQGRDDFQLEGTQFEPLEQVVQSHNSLEKEDEPLQLKITEEESQEVLSYDAEIFIDLVKSEPALWNTSSRSYKEQNKRKNAWDKISRTFGGIGVDSLKGQWKNLKENYKRCLDKRNRMMRSGAASHTLPKCKYFETLAFLSDKISSKETCSNIVLPVSEISDESDQLTYNDMSTTLSSPQSSYSIDSSVPEAVATGKKRKMNKQGNDLSARADYLTVKYLESSMLENTAEKDSQRDEPNMMFFKSLLPSMKRLSRKKNRMARIKIQEIIFELEEEEE